MKEKNELVEIMNHPIYKVISCKIIAPYTLQIHFDDITIQTINFQSVLAGEMYGPLIKIELFNQVKIDPEVHTLVWPNGADFNPATLHDWQQQEFELQSRMKKWGIAA